MIALLALASVVNAHVVYQVKQEKEKKRAELWLLSGRAHLKSPEREVFWDLIKERRLDLFGGRSRDEPIAFSRIVQRDELFPRGLTLPARGQRRILGRTCQLYSHRQEVPTGESTVQSQLTWCIWQGVPLSLDYSESICKRGKCRRSTTQWQAVDVATGVVKDTDVKRP